MEIEIEQELNIRLATHFLGIKKIYYSEWDTDKSSPMCIPSGKPWRTHQIDARPVPCFTRDIDACFRVLVPKSKMDTLWIINNLDSPTPKIEYCFGFIRGKDNDLICWSRDLPEEDCLSPIANTPSLAVCYAIDKLLSHDVNKTDFICVECGKRFDPSPNDADSPFTCRECITKLRAAGKPVV